MRCQLHKSHDRLLVDVDYLDNQFKMYVYDYDKYISDDIHYWCPANDIVSKQIYEEGNWEEYETVLVLDILKKPHRSNLVVDFGSQIGWYSLLSLNHGYTVISYEADEDSAQILKESVKLNGFEQSVVNNMPIDRNTESHDPAFIHFMKCDIEGNEKDAFRMYKSSFENKLVDYAIFEISPVFNNSYTKLVQDVMNCGYAAYVIPNAGSKSAEQYLANPLENIQTRPELDVNKIKDWHQKNVLFVKW